MNNITITPCYKIRLKSRSIVAPAPNLSCSRHILLDVRNACQLVSSLVQNRFFPRLVPFRAVMLSISLCFIPPGMFRIRPVRSADSSLKGILLPDQILLSGIGDRHVAGVSSESRLIASRGDVVVLSRTETHQLQSMSRSMICCSQEPSNPRR
jgi:hypothetical protein